MICKFLFWRRLKSMGKIIKILSVAKLQDNKIPKVEFELNEPAIIHIQNEAWRLEMSTPEFIQFATCCVEARDKLKRLKVL